MKPIYNWTDGDSEVVIYEGEVTSTIEALYWIEKVWCTSNLEYWEKTDATKKILETFSHNLSQML